MTHTGGRFYGKERWTSAAMYSLRLGDRVMFRERAFFVRGMTPMGVTSRRVLLGDAATGELVQASFDDIQAEAANGSGAPSALGDGARWTTPTSRPFRAFDAVTHGWRWHHWVYRWGGWLTEPCDEPPERIIAA